MFQVNKEKCVGCGKCVKDCIVKDIAFDEDRKAHIANKRCFACGHCIAICPVNAVTTDHIDQECIVDYNKETFELESENLLNSMKFRRSVRFYKDQPIEAELLEKVLEAGRYAPTASNAQDVSFIVLQDELEVVTDMIYDDLKERGAALLETKPAVDRTVAGYAKLWMRMHQAYYTDKVKSDRLFFHAPTVIMITSSNTVNATIAAANMELMANTLGLGCCYIGFTNYAVDHNENLQRKIGMPEGHQLVTTLTIGYPDVKYARTAPRKKAQVIWK